MKGKCRVRKRATNEEARQGTAISGWPLRAVRIRLVAKGVRVIAVFKPADKTNKAISTQGDEHVGYVPQTLCHHDAMSPES